MSIENEITITKIYVLFIKDCVDNQDVQWNKVFSSTEKKEVKKRFALYTHAKIEEHVTIVAKTRKTILSK